MRCIGGEVVFKVGDIAILKDCDEVVAEYKEYNFNGRKRIHDHFVYLPGGCGVNSYICFNSYLFGHFGGSEVEIVATQCSKDGIYGCELLLPNGERCWASELMLTPVECGCYDFDERSFTSLLSGE